jgi:hypothetical protein
MRGRFTGLPEQARALSPALNRLCPTTPFCPKSQAVAQKPSSRKKPYKEWTAIGLICLITFLVCAVPRFAWAKPIVGPNVQLIEGASQINNLGAVFGGMGSTENVLISCSRANIQMPAVFNLFKFAGLVTTDAAPLALLGPKEALATDGWLPVSSNRVVDRCGAGPRAVQFQSQILGLRIAAILPFNMPTVHNYVANFSWLNPLSGRLFDENESTLTGAHSFIGLPQNAQLQSQNSYSQETHEYQSSRPATYYLRPFCYFVGGAGCLIIGWFIVGYAVPYGSNKKYQTGQYVIDSLVCFGLIIIAFLIVAQGAYLIFLATTNNLLASFPTKIHSSSSSPLAGLNPERPVFPIMEAVRGPSDIRPVLPAKSCYPPSLINIAVDELAINERIIRVTEAIFNGEIWSVAVPRRERLFGVSFYQESVDFIVRNFSRRSKQPYRQIESWSPAEIFNSEFMNVIKFAIWRIEPVFSFVDIKGIFQEHISPQVSLRGIFGAQNQCSGSPPQSSGKDRQYRSECGDDALVIVADKITYADYQRNKRALENGTVFIAILTAAGAIWWWMAGFKR